MHELTPGTICDGQYEIVALLSRTAMSSVYRARDLETGREVALKFLEVDGSTPAKLERFAREVQIGDSLDHPGIVPIVTSGSFQGVPYLVMPFLDGESLRTRLERDGPMSLADTRQVTSEVGAALAHAHAREVVHRDVKPSNIFLTSQGAVVLDFGVAKPLSEISSMRLTQTGVAIGTPKYMSPEQASGEQRIDARSDQYSLGCTVQEMLTGEPPFTGRSERAIIARHISALPPTVSIVRPDLPGAVSEAIEKALAKSPAARHGSIADFVEALHSDRDARARPVTPTRLAATVLAVLLVAVGIWRIWPQQGLDSNRVVGFPLAEVGSASGDEISGVDVAIWLGLALQRAYPLKWLDAWDWLDPQQRVDIANVTGAQARRLAEELGAARYITGVLQRSPDSTRVVLRLWDVQDGSLLRQESAASVAGDFGSRSALSALVELLPSIVDPDRAIDMTFMSEREPVAVASWIEGDREYRAARFGPALEAYSRALELDPLVAPAALKGAQAASWLENRDEALRLVSLALDHRAQLNPVQRALAVGFEAYLAGEPVRADSALRVATGLDPEWAEAWMALGEAHYHLVGAQGDTTARNAFARSAAADIDFAPPRIHLFEVAVADHDLSAAAALIETVRRGVPASVWDKELDLLGRCSRDAGSVDWAREVSAAFLSVRQASRALGVRAAHAECSEAAHRAILGWPQTSSGDRFGAVKALNGLLVARGRDDEALAIVDSAYNGGNPLAGLLYLTNAAAGVETQGRDTLFATWLTDLLRGQYGEDYLLGPQTSTVWVLLSWYGVQGNAAETLRFRNALAQRLERDGDPITALALGAAEGWHRLAEADTSGAIVAFEALALRGTPLELAWDLAIPMAPERMVLAELLHRVGRSAEALEVARVLDHPQPVAFLPFQRRSLELRIDAARALGLGGDADRSRTRLDRLTRE